MANLESNFAIAIMGMTIVCIVLIGFPITFMIAKGFGISLGGMTLSISNSNVFVAANATTDGNSNDGNAMVKATL